VGAQPSSEAEIRPRVRIALDRGGVLLEGCPGWKPDGPRALDGFERGGVSPEGVSSPRAMRSFGGTTPGPSSEAEFRPRGAGADRLMGR
jgi:hypothetical protein